MAKKLGPAEQTASQKLEIGESSSLDLSETFLSDLLSAEGHIPSDNQQSQSNEGIMVETGRSVLFRQMTFPTDMSLHKVYDCAARNVTEFRK